MTRPRPRPYDPKLGPKLLDYAASIDELDTPDDVLDHLHTITWQCCHLSVFGAGLFPVRWDDWRSVEIGKTVFIHKSVPRGWWDEYLELSRREFDPGLMMAQVSLVPYTLSESTRMLEPIGADRWPRELALKYGIRDTLTCPVGGRWAVGFWSRSTLSEEALPQEVRAMLFMGATFAAIRLQKLIGDRTKRIGKGAFLTPREPAVLRSMSVGRHTKETAEHLELGEETVRSHLKKAQAKLGVHDRTHAVAQAIRLHLIP